MASHSSQQSHQQEPERDPWELAAGWVEDTRAPAQQNEAIDRMRRYRPNIVKKVLAWTSVVFGVLMASTALMPEPEYAIQHILGSLVLGVIFALPGLYWLYRTRQDRRRVQKWTAQHQENEQMRQFLQGSELDLLGEPRQSPLLPKRRWGRVALSVVGLLILFGVVSPPVD